MQVNFGDIVIISLYNIEIQYKIASDNYCFKGIAQKTLEAPVVYPLENDEEFHQKKIDHYPNEKKFENFNVGKNLICHSVGCLKGVNNYLDAKVFEGNIYLTIVDKLPLDQAFKQGNNKGELFHGETYTEGPNLPIFSKNIIRMFMESNDQKNPLLYLLLQNFEGLSAGF